MSSQWPTPERPDVAAFVARGVELLRSEGVHVDVFAFRGGRDPRRYLRARAEVGGRLRSGSFDLVHAHFGVAGLAIPPDPPLVVSLYDENLALNGFARAGLSAWLLASLTRRAVQRADAVILASRRLAANMPQDTSFDVISPGVDLETFQPRSREESRARLGFPAGGQLVLFARAPLTRDAFFRAFEAVSMLRPRLDVDLVALPHVPRDMVACYINAADVVLVGGRTVSDVLTVKQALACNRRVVALNFDETRALIGMAEGCATYHEETPRVIAGELERALSADNAPGETRALVSDQADRDVALRVLSLYQRLSRSKS